MNCYISIRVVGLLHYPGEKNVSISVLNVTEHQIHRNYLHPSWPLGSGWIAPEIVTPKASSGREANVPLPKQPSHLHLTSCILPSDPTFLQVQWPQPPTAETSL